MEGYKEILTKCIDNNITIPIVAIGGITSTDILELLNAGIYGVAVASAVTLSENKKETIQEFMSQLEHNTIKAH